MGTINVPQLPSLPRDNVRVEPVIQETHGQFWLDPTSNRPRCRCGGCGATLDVWGTLWGRWRVGHGFTRIWSAREHRWKNVKYDILSRGWTCASCSLKLDAWKRMDVPDNVIPDAAISNRIIAPTRRETV